MHTFKCQFKPGDVAYHMATRDQPSGEIDSFIVKFVAFDGFGSARLYSDDPMHGSGYSADHCHKTAGAAAGALQVQLEGYWAPRLSMVQK